MDGEGYENLVPPCGKALRSRAVVLVDEAAEHISPPDRTLPRPLVEGDRCPLSDALMRALYWLPGSSVYQFRRRDNRRARIAVQSAANRPSRGRSRPCCFCPVLAVYSIRSTTLALSWGDCQNIRLDGVNGQHRGSWGSPGSGRRRRTAAPSRRILPPVPFPTDHRTTPRAARTTEVAGTALAAPMVCRLYCAGKHLRGVVRRGRRRRQFHTGG
jgi:hypothetical protein